jgi:CRP/FNR family transcriptional regulator, cyclic AMP receptor protein
VTAARPRSHVLARDVELLTGLGGDDARAAAAHAPAQVFRVAVGDWHQPLAERGGPGDVGFLVLEGLLLREVRIGGSACCELVGRGDLIRPWDEDEVRSVQVRTEWRAHAPALVALLDAAWGRAVAPWPEVMHNLLRRSVQRSQSLAVYLAISHVVGVDQRVLTILWHFADRWGHVAQEGTVLPLNLTHELLGTVVGARRQTVSAAVTELVRRGAITRAVDGSRWVLHERPEPQG